MPIKIVASKTAFAVRSCRFPEHVGKDLVNRSHLGKIFIIGKAKGFELLLVFRGNLVIEIFCNDIRVEFFVMIDHTGNAESGVSHHITNTAKRARGHIVLWDGSFKLSVLFQVENVVFECKECTQRKSHDGDSSKLYPILPMNKEIESITV